MKKQLHILFIIIGMLSLQHLQAQVDFNKLPTDDLGDFEDEFQEFFYEALKQKGIQNFDRSVEALLKCIDLDKSVPVLYFELGKNYNKLKNFGAAEEALKEAVNKAPDNEWFLDALYEFYVQQDEQDKAIKMVKQLVKFHPDYKEDLATLYFKTKKYDEALKLLNELDTEFGVSYKRDATRNRIYDASGRKKDQIKNLETRVDNNPEKESNYLALIYRYSENNQKEEAFKTAQELLKINPNSQIVHLALYKFYLDDGKAEKAIESMKIVVKSSQIKPEAKQKVLSDFIQFAKDNPQYEAHLIEATTLVSSVNDGKTLLELGQYYLKTGEKEKALKYFEEASKYENENFTILKHILLLHIDLQHYDIAEKKSSKALEKYPSQPLCYLINGVAHNQLNQPKNAIASLEAGLDWILDDPKMEIDFYKQLSQAHTLLNNTEKAKTFNDKVKQLQSLN